jgi:hypothetical protein
MQTSDDWGLLLFRSNQWKGEKISSPQTSELETHQVREYLVAPQDFQWQQFPDLLKFSEISLNFVIFSWWNPPHFDPFISFMKNLLELDSSGGATPTPPTCFRTLCAKTLPMPAPAGRCPKPKNPLVDHGSWWFSLYEKSANLSHNLKSFRKKSLVFNLKFKPQGWYGFQDLN